MAQVSVVLTGGCWQGTAARYLACERSEVTVAAAHRLHVAADGAVRRFQGEHRLARFLSERHEAAEVLEGGEA